MSQCILGRYRAISFTGAHTEPGKCRNEQVTIEGYQLKRFKDLYIDRAVVVEHHPTEVRRLFSGSMLGLYVVEIRDVFAARLRIIKERVELLRNVIVIDYYGRIHDNVFIPEEVVYREMLPHESYLYDGPPARVKDVFVDGVTE